MRRLYLYSRPGCHLCEELEAELRAWLGERPLAVEIVDVDGDPGLAHRYGLRIPVLADEEEEVSGFPLDRDRIERWYTGGSGGCSG